MYDCAYVGGLLSCPTEGGGWGQCQPPLNPFRSAATQPPVATGDAGAAPAAPLGSTITSAPDAAGGDASPGALLPGTAGAGGSNLNGIAGGLGGSYADTDLSDYAVGDGTRLGPAGGAMPRLTVNGQVGVRGGGKEAGRVA